jgi:hypothetical protein
MKRFLLFYLLFQNYCSFSQGCSDAGACSTGSLSILGFIYENLPVEESTLTRIEDVSDPALIIYIGSRKDSISSFVKADTSLLGKKEKDILPAQSTTNFVSKKAPASLLYYIKYPKYYFQLSTYYGVGDRGTIIIIPQLDVNVRLLARTLFAQIKLPYAFISGKLGQVKGMGDVTFSVSYLALSQKKSTITLTAGVKIPSNNANLLADQFPLPMVYQTSLGATDLLLGTKFTFKKWEAIFAYQHAFNSNQNNYLHSASENSYFESNKLKRSDDAVLRINRNFTRKRSTVAPGLLFIYHLKNDTYINAVGHRLEAIGSKGLTLNFNFAASIPLTKKTDFTFVFASPFVVRDARPDGLTRKYVVVAGFKYNIY